MTRSAGGSGIHFLFASWGAGGSITSLLLTPRPLHCPSIKKKNMPWINVNELADDMNHFRMQIR